MSPEELFGEGATQVDMLALLLDSFPGQKDGVQVPIHPKARRPWAEELVRRGVRVHPDLMSEFPIPGDHPEAGWMNPHKWVPREQYEQHAESRPSPEQAENQMKHLLRAIDPERAARIDRMTPEEKAAEREKVAPEIPDVFDRVQELRKQFEGGGDDLDG